MDNVVVLQNNLRAGLLCMTLNSIAVMQNSIIIGNIVSKVAYNHSKMSAIQLINVEFARNYLIRRKLYMGPNCYAIIQINTFNGNNVSSAVYIYFWEDYCQTQ